MNDLYFVVFSYLKDDVVETGVVYVPARTANEASLAVAKRLETVADWESAPTRSQGPATLVDRNWLKDQLGLTEAL